MDLAIKLSNDYCFCIDSLNSFKVAQISGSKLYKDIFDNSSHPECVNLFAKKNSNFLKKLHPLKIGSSGAFKAYSKTKDATESCNQTQCESPSDSINRKGLLWEKVTTKVKCVESQQESSDFRKLPKMFDDSLCPEHLHTEAEGRLVGFYTQRERKNKIKHLRKRLLKHRQACPINKQYKGRSNAARSKVRLCGKFVKAELAEKYAVDDKVFHGRNKLIDKYVKQQDYQKVVEVLAEY
ncbi:unnamed protein product [Moneuplotes crassus]|uniref:CCT domain-containing protein n=1 Tax=Euplotes crassus TaxID=5936 RepID=A0AAD1U0C8_EUPCR|nr:unnamed protein product [Moneuplotes crassus]